mgnify:CR=1 FL=1
MALLKGKFGLTPAESRLVLRIMAGDSLRLSAAALGIGYETARTTLKTVFRKTGTCRQAELAIVIFVPWQHPPILTQHRPSARRQAARPWAAAAPTYPA